ncbi:tRNA-splicing endonuclease subunit sen54 [Thecaphora frezii]
MDSLPSAPQRAKARANPAQRNAAVSPATAPSPYPIPDDLDDPTSNAGPSTPSRPSSNFPSSSPATSGGGAAAGADDSEGEDEMPDYLRLAALTSGKNAKAKPKGGASSDAVVIPKRGEKDFEPTGFGGQAKLLERSREAMIAAISGQRRTINKGLTTASWDDDIQRAVVHELQGKLFETTGQIAKRQVLVPTTEGQPQCKIVSRNELLPEEALFMLERGSLLLFARPPPESRDEAGKAHHQVEPMSLQQAFSRLVSDASGLTRERYQIYVYLKRLGYVVQRADDVDRIRSAPPPPTNADRKRKKAAAFDAAATPSPSTEADKAADAKGILADPKRPIKLVNDLDLLLYIPRRLAQLAGDAVRWLAAWLRQVSSQMVRVASRVVGKLVGYGRSPTTTTTSTLGLGSGRRRGLLGTTTWDSYNGIYDTLQIVPSGHERHLPAQTQARACASPEADLRPFYYAWRPATSYRKTHPPPPEFRIAIVDAQKQPVPSAWEFETMFDAVPLPGSLEELGLDPSSAAAPTGKEGEEGEDEFQQRVRYEMQLKKQTEEANKRAYGKSSDGRLRFLEEKKKQRMEGREKRRKLKAAKWEGWVGIERADVVRKLEGRPSYSP